MSWEKGYYQGNDKDYIYFELEYEESENTCNFFYNHYSYVNRNSYICLNHIPFS